MDLISQVRLWLGDTAATVFAWLFFAFIMVGMSAIAGCSAVPYGSVATGEVAKLAQTAKTDRMKYNDDKAQILTAMPCDISLGAYFRLGNPGLQEALAEMCGGAKVAPVMNPLGTPSRFMEGYPNRHPPLGALPAANVNGTDGYAPQQDQSVPPS